MANLALNLPLPAFNGAGAAVNTSAMGAQKTFSVTGSFGGATITIEASNDGGVTFQPVQSFSSMPKPVVLLLVAQFLRVRVDGRNVSVAFSAVIEVAANDEGSQFTAIPMPVGNGVGASVNTNGFGGFWTFIVGGSFQGSTVTIEVSEDNVTWSQLVLFSSVGGVRSLPVTALFVRTRVAGRNPAVAFTAVAAGGASNDPVSVLGVNVQDEGVAIPNNPHGTLNFTGSGVTATDVAGVATVTIEGTFANFVFRPGGVQAGNVFNNWAALMAAMTPVQGWKTIQFDDSIVSPCVIPAGTYDMTNVEWTAFLKGTVPAGTSVSIGGVPSGGDCFFPNLRSFGGSLNPLTNLNTTGAPIVIPGQAAYAIEMGEGTTGDFPQIVNNGASPFFDMSAMGAGQTFLLRIQGSISGATPAIEMGASAGNFQVSLYDSARIQAGMVNGSNVAANLQIVNFGTSGQVSRQATFAGTITYGRPNSFTGLVGWPRMWMFPAPVNQANPAPSAAAIVAGTGLGMNTCLRFDTTAADINQTLPIIRAAAPAIGSFSTTPGALEAMGLVVTIKNEVGTHNVNVSPDGTTPDTIDGGAGAIVIPPGSSRTFISNGVSNWSVIGNSDRALGQVMALPEQWGQANVVANQNNVALTALVSQSFDTVKAIRAGSIVGLGTRFTEAITAGQITVEVTINGAGTGFTVVSTNAANQTGGVAVQAVGADTYVAGDLIGVRITTNAGFLPITTDLEAWVEVFENVS